MHATKYPTNTSPYPCWMKDFKITLSISYPPILRFKAIYSSTKTHKLNTKTRFPDQLQYQTQSVSLKFWNNFFLVHCPSTLRLTWNRIIMWFFNFYVLGCFPSTHSIAQYQVTLYFWNDSICACCPCIPRPTQNQVSTWECFGLSIWDWWHVCVCYSVLCWVFISSWKLFVGPMFITLLWYLEDSVQLLAPRYTCAIFPF